MVNETELPDDVVRWVSLHFNEADQEQALVQLRSATIHNGQPAEARLLRCVVFSSGGDLKRLADRTRELGTDWHDVIAHAEYRYHAGKDVRVRDFNYAIDAKMNTIPIPIQGQKYISLTTFRKTGVAVATPVWFGEEDGKLYVMTRSDMGKTKRIRNNPQVKVAPCTIRGKVTGPEFSAAARLLPPEDHKRARQTLNRKYLMARLTSPFSRADAFLEITFA